VLILWVGGREWLLNSGMFVVDLMGGRVRRKSGLIVVDLA
jgi:hypothetical protein